MTSPVIGPPPNNIKTAKDRTKTWLQDTYKKELGRDLKDEGEKYWTADIHDRGQTQEQEEKEDEKPVVPEPEKPCPSGQVRGTSGTCIDDKEYADNPWEEPGKTPKELVNWRNKFDSYDPGAGSIDYLTPNMSRQYKPTVGSGKFSGFLRANQYQQDRSN